MINSFNKQKVISKVLNLFNDCEGIILTGSFLTKKFDVNSDIDVILISSKINHSFTEKIQINNILFELIYIPINKVDLILKNDIVNLKGVLINMLSSCEVIKNDENISTNLISYSRYLHQKNYPFLDEHKKAEIQLKIIDNIEELCFRKNDFVVNFIIINEITTLFIFLYANKKAAFIGNAKNKLTALKKYFPDVYEKLQASIKKTIITKNEDYFITFIKSESEIENTKKEYSERSLRMNLATNSDLKINFPMNIVKKEVFLSIQGLSKKLSLVDYSISKKQIEITLSNLNISYLKIICIIQKTFGINNTNISKIKLSSQKLDILEISHKLKISKLLLDSIPIISSNYILFGIELINKLLERLVVDDKKAILDFLFDYWLPYSYDEELAFDFFTLNSMRAKTILFFENEQENLYIQYSKKEFNFDNVLNQLYEIYKLYETNDDFENSFISKHISHKFNPLDIANIIKLENFLSKIFDMIDLNEKKAQIIFFLKNNKNEFR